MIILILLKITLVCVWTKFVIGSFFILKWCQLCSGPSFAQGWKDIGVKIYLFTACANCYLWFYGKVIFKTGNIPSTWSWLNAVVRFECEYSATDVIINFLWKIFHNPIGLVVLTTANFGGFSNFCRYYTRSQTGKSTGYRPTLKPLLPGLGHGTAVGPSAVPRPLSCSRPPLIPNPGSAPGYDFFLKKYSDSQCCWKKYSDFGGDKTK